MLLQLYVGIEDGQVVNWSYDGSERPSYGSLTLFQEGYWDDYDDELGCRLYWTLDATSVDPGDSWLAYDLVWNAYTETIGCMDLDPAVYGEDPTSDIGVDLGHLHIERMSSYTRSTLAELGWEPPDDAISADISTGGFDEQMTYYSDLYPELQVYYGYGYRVDPFMSTDLSEYLTQEEMAEGADGVYLLHSFTYGAPG
jgi:hypothetical protein